MVATLAFDGVMATTLPLFHLFLFSVFLSASSWQAEHFDIPKYMYKIVFVSFFVVLNKKKKNKKHFSQVCGQ